MRNRGAANATVNSNYWRYWGLYASIVKVIREGNEEATYGQNCIFSMENFGDTPCGVQER